ncbi:MAG TPA: A/G-specific adenine glycosylase [Ilumatobacteraceae bacterium]|nr:A/G-specific adenine glycosylase [Ilumatobacteraceae bacterium]
MLQWGMARPRDLPWRRTRDPWAVLVSEVMLQQTQARRVIPKWERFMAAYPIASACADASLGDVLRMWQGLGYPRRAKNLHDAAAVIAARGQFPRTLDELLQLPGVGAYTARAVMVFAFEADCAVVDTNIARVLARVAGSRLTALQVQAAADDLVPAGDSWAWNQCLMDLGATLCRPVNPQCAACPLAASCVWRRRGGDDPALGSAGVSVRQSPFDGSDRQARGRLLKVLGNAPLACERVAAVMGCDEPRAVRLLADLERDGLVVRRERMLRLP